MRLRWGVGWGCGVGEAFVLGVWFGAGWRLDGHRCWGWGLDSVEEFCALDSEGFFECGGGRGGGRWAGGVEVFAADAGVLC